MMTEIQYGETVIGLPDHTQLPLDFWEDVLVETIPWQPIADDELGIVWQSGHIQDYSDLVRLLSASQMLTGLHEEIHRNLAFRSGTLEKSGYLKELTQKLKVDHLREAHERQHSFTMDFANDDLERLKSTAQKQLLNEIQVLLNNAYNFVKTGNPLFNPLSTGFKSTKYAAPKKLRTREKHRDYVKFYCLERVTNGSSHEKAVRRTIRHYEITDKTFTRAVEISKDILENYDLII